MGWQEPEDTGVRSGSAPTPTRCPQRSTSTSTRTVSPEGSDAGSSRDPRVNSRVQLGYASRTLTKLQNVERGRAAGALNTIAVASCTRNGVGILSAASHHFRAARRAAEPAAMCNDIRVCERCICV